MNVFIVSLLLLPLFASAQENLDIIEVNSEKSSSFSEFWEENKGTQIFSGKKNTVTDLKEIPQLQTNNYRQAISQTPGLLVSEIPNEALAAITYRGLGNPHESYELLLLQDGIPVAADMFGYPAHYFSPALPMMEKVQFIRGGAGLLYGPQPGGALNYMSHPLTKGQKTSGKAGLTYGSYNLANTNTALYGSKGDHAYAIEYFRRQGDGPQKVNSDFTADYVQIRNHTFKGKNKYKLSFNGYNSDHGETGGFAKNPGANANVFGDDLSVASKRHDRLKVSRAQLSAGVEHRLDDSSQLHVNLWATAYNRYSKRQKQINKDDFGIFATQNANDITTQKYYGYNGEIRYLTNYNAFGNEHTFSGGLLTYHLHSPRTDETGARADANQGVVTARTQRETHTNSAFVENRFSFGKLMVTPGIRFENIYQTVEEKKKSGKGQNTENVPLLGIGLSYHLSDDSQLYANSSEAYKPFTWSNAVVTAANESVAGDIHPSKILSHEIGYRGQTQYLNWDVSAFLIRYEDRVGKVANVVQNVGAATNRGFDVATELKLSQIFTKLKPMGDFNFYANVEVLDAKFTNGAQKGNTPQYAPKTITRAGLIYSHEQKIKIALMSVFMGSHFADDANPDNFEIPSYTVFDLTADYTFKQNWMISAGINNLLNREYYSRVRSDGINWALDRNFYAGMTYKF